jgi:hypothetical protein
MNQRRALGALVLLTIVLLGAVKFGSAAAPTLPPPRPAPKLDAVAETRLLMEGIIVPNFRGLEKSLQQKPADADTWAFARGQALLIGESGNLLMLRPPRNFGEADWMDRSTELRTAAVRLARTCAEHDFERSRAALGEVAAACNRCHQNFRVKARIVPFEGQ